MILALVASVAFAEPAGGEILLGWAGNATHGYGFATAQPAIARSEDASLVLRGTASHLFDTYFDGASMIRIDSPGASLGVGFKLAPGPLSFGLGISFETRRPTQWTDGENPQTKYVFGAALSTELYWTPSRRLAIYGVANLSGANAYLWTRAGFVHQLIPMFQRGTKYALWAGLDATARGNKFARGLEGGGVVELRMRDLHASVALRGGYAVEVAGDRVLYQGTGGVGVYWWYK